MKELLIATHNPGKLKEFRELLQPRGITVRGAADYDLPEPEETGTTFTENALLKARAAAQGTGLAALADDSGLCVRALDGAPGVYSARWAGPGKDFSVAMARVQREIGDKVDRSAYFTAVLALVKPDGTEQLFEGRCDGTIIWPPRGEGGFGYDPMFQPDGYTHTFSEMDKEEKHAISHRSRALQKFLDSLA